MLEWAGITTCDERNIGIAYASLQRWKHAIECYTSKKTSKENPILWEYLGHAYHATGAYDLEIQAYETAIQKDPKRAQPHAYLACAYKTKGDIEKADSYCRKAIELNPDMRQYLEDNNEESPNRSELIPMISFGHILSFIKKSRNPRVLAHKVETNFQETCEIHNTVDSIEDCLCWSIRR